MPHSEARKIFTKLSQKNPNELKTSEAQKEWAEALVSLWALDVMLGQEEHALSHLKKCRKFCEKWLEKEFWAEPKKWGCRKDPKQAFC